MKGLSASSSSIGEEEPRAPVEGDPELRLVLGGGRGRELAGGRREPVVGPPVGPV
jgi:hypothetical protein